MIAVVAKSARNAGVRRQHTPTIAANAPSCLLDVTAKIKPRRAAKSKQTSQTGGLCSIPLRQAKNKNEPWVGFVLAIFWLVGFLLCGNLGINTFLRVFLISLVCILLDLYFMSKMRSRSVFNKKEPCTKSVHAHFLYIIRVILKKPSSPCPFSSNSVDCISHTLCR